MFSKPRSVRNRSSSSSGLIPASSRRKTFRISSSSKTIDVFDCSAPTGRASRSSGPSPGEALDGAELDGAFVPGSVAPDADQVHELAHLGRVGRARRGPPSTSSWYVSCVPVSKPTSTSCSSSAGSPSRNLARSTTEAWITWRDFEPNQRWRGDEVDQCLLVAHTDSSFRSWNQKNPRGPSVSR